MTTFETTMIVVLIVAALGYGYTKIKGNKSNPYEVRPPVVLPPVQEKAKPVTKLTQKAAKKAAPVAKYSAKATKKTSAKSKTK